MNLSRIRAGVASFFKNVSLFASASIKEIKKDWRFLFLLTFTFFAVDYYSNFLTAGIAAVTDEQEKANTILLIGILSSMKFWFMPTYFAFKFTSKTIYSTNSFKAIRWLKNVLLFVFSTLIKMVKVVYNSGLIFFQFFALLGVLSFSLVKFAPEFFANLFQVFDDLQKSQNLGVDMAAYPSIVEWTNNVDSMNHFNLFVVLVMFAAVFYVLTFGLISSLYVKFSKGSSSLRSVAVGLKAVLSGSSYFISLMVVYVLLRLFVVEAFSLNNQFLNDFLIWIVNLMFVVFVVEVVKQKVS